MTAAKGISQGWNCIFLLIPLRLFTSIAIKSLPPHCPSFDTNNKSSFDVADILDRYSSYILKMNCAP
jgi:hypothetical protein